MCSSASSHDVCSSVSSDWNSSNRGIFFDNEESSANIHRISCTIPVWGLLERQIFSAKDKCHRMDLLAEGCFGSSPEAEHLRWNCILGSVCVQLGICILDVFLVNRRYLGEKKEKLERLRNRKYCSRVDHCEELFITAFMHSNSKGTMREWESDIEPNILCHE